MLWFYNILIIVMVWSFLDQVLPNLAPWPCYCVLFLFIWCQNFSKDMYNTLELNDQFSNGHCLMVNNFNEWFLMKFINLIDNARSKTFFTNWCLFCFKAGPFTESHPGWPGEYGGIFFTYQGGYWRFIKVNSWMYIFYITF